MTPRGRRLAGLAALLVATAADAADWTRVETVGTDAHSYDRSKLAIRGDEVTYWRRVVFPKPVRVRVGLARSALYHERIHCRDHTLKALAWQLFADEGSVLETSTTPEAEIVAIAIVPETVGDRFQDVMCRLVEARRRREADIARDEAQLATRRKDLEQLKAEIDRLEAAIDRMRFEAALTAPAAPPAAVATPIPPAAAGTPGAAAPAVAPVTAPAATAQPASPALTAPVAPTVPTVPTVPTAPTAPSTEQTPTEAR